MDRPALARLRSGQRNKNREKKRPAERSRSSNSGASISKPGIAQAVSNFIIALQDEWKRRSNQFLSGLTFFVAAIVFLCGAIYYGLGGLFEGARLLTGSQLGALGVMFAFCSILTAILMFRGMRKMSQSVEVVKRPPEIRD